MAADAQQIAAFRRAAAALNEAGDRGLRKEVYAAFRRAAKPLGDKVIREGAAELPRRGGLSARVAASSMRQSNSTKGRNPGVALTLKTKPSSTGQSYDLKTIDAGTIRHPVFARAGRARVWSRQSIRSGAFTTPFEAGVGPVRDEVVRAMETVAEQIAHQSNRG